MVGYATVRPSADCCALRLAITRSASTSFPPARASFCSTVAPIATNAAIRCPDRFDIARDAHDHLAWGIGPHMCIGMHLERVEMEVMLEALVDQRSR
ncbi:cytochrome P450 [Bradyrhizobium sp. USDA 4518]